MYKIFPLRSLTYLISFLTLTVFLVIELATDAFGFEVRLLAIPGIVWVILLGFAFNPIWRKIWSWSAKIPFIPDLNDKIFPDLNGEWEMLLESNWSRQEQILEAAKDGRRSFDIKSCDQNDLEPLMQVGLKAEIEQSWWSIKITVTNPRQDTPIKESQTNIVIPRKKSEGQPSSLCYFYDQTNDTDNQADDPEFSASACLSYDYKRDILEGTFWTERQWRRAMNTAGRLTLKRM
ncbi:MULTISPECIES: hypothetical protein [Sphingomonadaceae]|nr:MULTISPECIES: hypothetical protein [unclassified Sphingorhabdus]ASK87164.1 hypothetical protein SPHFLASMR4Y_00374 [Sphingorhabdus sp. SMR4y]VWX62270.1 conserved hypothetical protein [Sphingorhabdus sp. 109]|tara:strand:- start:382 stop:1083 length:702 start_codon:yes stop_codon:yes gene_type:complete